MRWLLNRRAESRAQADNLGFEAHCFICNVLFDKHPKIKMGIAVLLPNRHVILYVVEKGKTGMEFIATHKYHQIELQIIY